MKSTTIPIKSSFISFILLITLSTTSCSENKKNNNQEGSEVELKVMTWNIWGKLNLAPKYTINGKTARDRVVEIIKDSGADIITMTETYGSAKDIAAALGYHYYTPSADANLSFFSRFPLEDFGEVEGLSSFSFIRSTVLLPNNKKLKVYNIWLTSGGRHIVEVKNKAISDEEFNAGDTNRYNHILELLTHKEFKNDMAAINEIPVIVAGDFNCVSHLDYTPTTKAKGLNHSRVLNNKVSLAMSEAGFSDSYRKVHSKITSKSLGYTWTTVGQGYTYVSGEGFMPVKVNPRPLSQDPYARIDYIYFSGDDIQVIDSRTITRHTSNPNRSFPEFPSDHGAVLSTFSIKK